MVKLTVDHRQQRAEGFCARACLSLCLLLVAASCRGRGGKVAAKGVRDRIISRAWAND
jgi:hypothetical protein